MKELLARIGQSYDLFFSEHRIHLIERIVISIALVSFIFHLLLIFIANELSPDYPLIATLQGSYLGAIYTPYSLILFFEVFLLVLSIPNSFTSSIGKQFEIISLIILRRVFKDISDFHGVDDWYNETETIISVGLDMGASILLFFLVFLFQYLVIRQRYLRRAFQKEVLTPFINFKKAISLLLCLILGVIAIYHFTDWMLKIIPHAEGHTLEEIDVNAIFYEDLFGLMIFTDVTLLIVSFIYTQDFPQVFRNSSFVISTILLRLSFSADKPISLSMIIISILFSIATVWIYGNLEKLTHKKKDLNGSLSSE